MYSSVDYSVTPRPNYLADGRKIPDVYSHPPELRDILQDELGQFPLFNFWGPRTSIISSEWIAEAAIKTDSLYNPTLSLVYLPHLDYNLQRHGNDFSKISGDLKDIDNTVKKLVDYFQNKDCDIYLLSEYGITDVNRPVHLNRALREAGYLSIREERGLELLDAGASKAFAVADHQIAHIYCNDDSCLEPVRQLLSAVPGVEQVYRKDEIASLAHPRAGDLTVIADEDSWFTYYYWLEDQKAPDFARTVDIHRKPGYDPVEMFTDPSDKLTTLKVIGKLLSKKLGFRTLMNIIPLDASLVKGSHGRIPSSSDDFPIFICDKPDVSENLQLDAKEVFDILYRQITINHRNQ